MKLIALGLTLVATLALAACNTSAGGAGTPTPTPTPGTTLTVEQIIEQARQAAEAVESYRYRSEETYGWEGEEGAEEFRVQAVGEWTSAGGFRAEMDVRPLIPPIGGQDGPFEYIFVDGRLFERHAQNDEVWREVTWPEILGEPPASLIPNADEWELTDQDISVSGTPAYRLDGTRTQEPQQMGDQGKVLTASFTYSLHVSQQDMLPLALDVSAELQVVGPEGNTAPLEQSWDFEFWDYNAPVTVELPDPEDRVDLPDPDATPTPFPTPTPTRTPTPVLPTFAPAGPGSDGALLTGELLVEGRCVYLLDEFGVKWLPVFEAGSVSWEANGLILGGERYEAGETVSVGGGEVSDLSNVELVQTPSVLCDTRNAWLAWPLP